MASVKSQTQCTFESDFRLRGMAGVTGTFFARLWCGDQATAVGVSLFALYCTVMSNLYFPPLRLASPRPFLGCLLAVLAGTSEYVSILALSCAILKPTHVLLAPRSRDLPFAVLVAAAL
jgi:hypothetical protein